MLATNAPLSYTATRCLQDAGRRFWLLGRGRYPAARASRWCLGQDRFAPEALADDGLARRIAAELEGRRLAAVIPVGIEATFYLAEHRTQLPEDKLFPLPEHALLSLLNDKWRFAELLDTLGLKQPQTHLVQAVQDLDSLPMRPPVVVKPLAAEGGQGVLVARDADALRQHVLDSAATGRLPLLVQEFVPGLDQGASALVDHGRVVACVVQRGTAGRSLEYVAEPDIAAVMTALCQATGYHGLLNLDFRRDERDGSLALLEANPRLFFTAHMATWSGTNLLNLGVRLIEEDCVPSDPVLPHTTVLNSVDGFRRILHYREMSDASQRMVRAELSDPVSSAVRRVEDYLTHKSPRLAARILDEPLTTWQGSWTALGS